MSLVAVIHYNIGRYIESLWISIYEDLVEIFTESKVLILFANTLLHYEVKATAGTCFFNICHVYVFVVSIFAFW